ncbi:MAG: polysaccharide pyruvyl transferase family protein [Candidatus Omnitrophota bacterium]|nr:polysaccharide pyruvyl transferase family protein [Candidatus Omnitrophota bacterium]
MNNFLIVGHTSSHNRGCEALARSTITILRKQFPAAKITVAALYPEGESPLINNITGLEIIPGFNRVSSVIGKYPFSHRILKFVKNILPYGIVALHDRNIGWKAMLPQARPKSETGFSRVRHLKAAMLEADAVILLGADLYNIENYFPPVYAMEVMEYAQLLGRKTVIWGASIWQFNRRWVERRVRDILCRANLVTARDEMTIDYLSKLGIKKNTVLVPDSAFLLQPRLTSRTGLPWTLKPQLVVGFNGSDFIYYYLQKRTYRKCIIDIIKFFQFIIDNFGCRIVFVPNDGYPGAQEREFLFEINSMIARRESVYMVPPGLDASEIKAVIGQCDIFLGMKFHPTIFSLSQGIPTLGMYYSPKFIGLHQSIFGHTDYLIHYNDISFDLLMLKFQQVKDDKDKIQQILRRRVPEIEAELFNAGKHLENLFA